MTHAKLLLLNYLWKKTYAPVWACLLLLGGLLPNNASAQAFDCSPMLYQVISGQLNQYNPATGDYTPIGPNNPSYNAIGYNVEDNYIYGILGSTTELVKIASDGSLTNLGPVANLDNNYVAGDFDLAGNLYIFKNGSDAFYKIDVDASTLVAELVAFSESVGSTLDFAHDPVTGKFYGVRSGGSFLHTVTTDGDVTITPTSGDVLSSTGGLGAVWATADGRLYASDNNSGDIFLMNVQTGEGALVAVGTPTNNNDGASCPSASIIFQEQCADNIDNDGDGDADCFDSECDCCAGSTLGVAIASMMIDCHDSADGTLTANAFGGDGNYTYLWENGATTASINNLGGGSYNVTVTDGTGCAFTASGVIFAPAPVGALITGFAYSTCAGSNNGTLTAIAFGGAGEPYTFTWSDGQTGATATGLAPGLHTVTAIDSRGCEGSTTYEVQLHPEGVWLDVTSTPSCGTASGTATAVGSLGTAPYTYTWSNGATGATITGLAAGTYEVTATDANGCEAYGSVDVGSGNPMNLSLSASYETCNGSADGTASVNASGGVQPYTYEWSNGQTTIVATGLSAGTYTVTVTDANGCQMVGSIEVELSPEGIWIMLSSMDATCGGNNGLAHVSAMTGVPPYTYQWDDPAMQTGEDAINLSPGIYSVTVTDANGCTAAGSVTVNSTDAVNVTVTSTPASCFDTADGAATANVLSGAAPYTYIWDTGETTASISGLAAGSYGVTVMDAAGCLGTAVAFIGSPKADAGILATDDPTTICADDGNPDIVNVTVTGSEGANYMFVVTDPAGNILAISTNPQFDFEGAGPGTCLIWGLAYEGTITGAEVGQNAADLQGCYDLSDPITITRQSPPDCGCDLTASVTTSPINCNGTSTGTATANPSGGTAPFTYNWSNSSTTQTITGLGAGSYAVTISDANGCTAEASGSIAENPALLVNIGSAPISCNGTNDGIAIANVSGGSGSYTYAWSNGATTQTVTGLGAGTYGLTVTDSEGCIGIDILTLTEPDALTATATATPASCNGSSDGTATAIPGGGTPPYTYSWSNGANTQSVSGLSGGTYDVTITDAGNCVAVASATVSDATPLDCNVQITAPVSTCDGNEGAMSASVNGGNAPYTYQWSNGASGASQSGLSAGTYEVTITDASGCSCVASATLHSPSSIGDYVWIDADQDGIQDSDESGLAGVTVTLTGTTATGTVNLTTTTAADGSYSFDGLAPGTYKVTFDTPANYNPSTADAGTDDDVDSDAGMGGMSHMINLGNGDCDHSVDAGFYYCNTNIGDRVWLDNDRDGIQDFWEQGYPNVLVKLTTAGPDGVFYTSDDVIVDYQLTDNQGYYLFECVEPGEYVIVFMNIPNDYDFTSQDEGSDDSIDSDANANGETDPFTVGSGQADDLSIDAGIHTQCDNLTDPGDIGYDQTICQGETPNAIIEIAPPVGGNGTIEYLWMYSTVPGPFDPSTWTPIAGATGPDYAPGQLYQTTFFVRCTRRAGCNTYLEPAPITITVNNCSNSPFVVFETHIMGGANGVMVKWATFSETPNATYEVQRSEDGDTFKTLNDMAGYGLQEQFNNYEYVDATPRLGVSYYRVKQVMPNGFTQYSDTQKIMLMPNGQTPVFAYPNPADNKITFEAVEPFQDEVILQVFNPIGQKIQTITIPAGTQKLDLDLRDLYTGTYVIKVDYKNSKESHVVRIFKR